ncbi:MAG: methyltransferase domain-containing protein [Candidatus Dojkabacteria bacterium]|nr:methyltransferase domain-containing protein [Candidatus Dojkabacteria bacterium]
MDWNKYAKHYDNLNHLIAYQDLKKQILSNANKYLPEKVTNILDLGCGAGNITEGLVRDFEEAEIYALDSSSEMLNVAISKIRSDKVIFKSFDINNITKFQPEVKYDLIVINNVLYTIDDKYLLLELLSNKLSNNGIIILSDPIPKEEYSYLRILLKQLVSLKSAFKTLMLVPSLLYIYIINKKIDLAYSRLNRDQYISLIKEKKLQILNIEKSYSEQANLFVIKK